MGRFVAAFVVLVAVAIGFGPARAGLAEGEIDVRVVAVDDAGFPLVTVVFMADAGGTPLTDVGVEEVAVVEAGEAARVISVQPVTDANIPLAMVLAMDLSGSMAGEPLERSRDAAAALVESLGPGDAVGVLTFADTVVVLQTPSAEKTAALAVVASLAAVGNTALYDAVAGAAELAAGAELSRRAVVLLSDGEDFGGQSAVGREGSLVAASGSGVPFYVIGLGTEVDRGYLEELAERTGGRFYEAPQPGDVAGIYGALEELLRSQLVVTVESAGPAGDMEREVRVRVERAEGSGEASMSYRSARPAPSSGPMASAVPATPTAIATRSPSPAAPAVSDDTGEAEGGGGAGWALPLAGLLLLAPAVAVFAVARRRRPGEATDDTEPSASDEPLPAPMPVEVGKSRSLPGGFLEVTGPAVQGVFELPHTPVTVGSGESCALQLGGAEGVPQEQFRLWWRDGQPVLHHIARDGETRVNGRAQVWASLRDGDVVEVGPFSLRYREQARNGAGQGK